MVCRIFTNLYSSNFKDDYIAKQLKCIEKIVNIGMPETNNIDGVYTCNGVGSACGREKLKSLLELDCACALSDVMSRRNEI